MEQVADLRGHVVYVRSPTSPPSWEAACRCGYRSPRYHSDSDAKQAGVAHAEEAPEFKQIKAKAKAKPKAKAKRSTKKTARKK